MENTDRGQVTGSAAEIYEKFFVPALFKQWCEPILSKAGVKQGQKILDVACGTGILARTAAKVLGSTDGIVGLDVNKGMLEVAEAAEPNITWKYGTAEKLPFADQEFDIVVSQFALMFFEDPHQAVQEMLRVIRPGGRLIIAVWDSLENFPGYAAMAELLLRLFGENYATGVRAPFVLGDVNKLRALLGEIITTAEITTEQGQVSFPSLDSWIYTEIKGWVLADMLDDDQFTQLLKEAQKDLAPFVSNDGTVNFKASAHFITLTK